MYYIPRTWSMITIIDQHLTLYNTCTKFNFLSFQSSSMYTLCVLYIYNVDMLKMTQTPWGREYNTHSVLLFTLHRLSKRILRSSVWRAASRLWSAWLTMPTRGSRQTHTTKRWTTRRITRPKLPRWLRTLQHSKRNWQSWLQSTRRRNNHWERFGIYLHV